MQPLRALIRENFGFALVLLVLSLCIKAIVPTGFMISASPDTVLTVKICTAVPDGLNPVQIVIPSKEHSDEHRDQANQGEHCAFSGLAKAAAGGADFILLALAFAFILALAPLQCLPFGQSPRLRPPLRGPPLTHI